MASCNNAIKKMLPKTYLRNYVAQEIHLALIHFKDLVPSVDKYTYNDGTTKVLMSLTGTIPILFKDRSFNIPICVWLEESYPQSAPICYVKPTWEMMILRGNYVSNNGDILLPYLQEWKQGKCDLVSLLQVMVATFGDLPPICMQPHPQPAQASYSALCKHPGVKVAHRPNTKNLSCPPPRRVQCTMLNVALGSLQFHKQSQVLSRPDGSLYVTLSAEDGQSVLQGNETSC